MRKIVFKSQINHWAMAYFLGHTICCIKLIVQSNSLLKTLLFVLSIICDIYCVKIQLLDWKETSDSIGKQLIKRFIELTLVTTILALVIFIN